MLADDVATLIYFTGIAEQIGTRDGNVMKQTLWIIIDINYIMDC